jgi:hypothetical protein
MKFFNGILISFALIGALITQHVTANAGDMLTGYAAASISDSVSSSMVESQTTQALMCLPLNFTFPAINMTSMCPNYIDVVAYEYMVPLSDVASFTIMCIIFLSIISCFNTCLFGSNQDREQMGDMFIGIFIHGLVRALCSDDD